MSRSLKRRRNRALLDAVSLDDTLIVEALLDLGADVNARDSEHGETALMLARSETMQLFLLDRGADIHARDLRGVTAFLLRPTPLLLKRGADINASDAEGETALMKAVQSASFSTVEWLVAAGADIEAQDKDGNTALSIANDYGFQALMGML